MSRRPQITYAVAAAAVIAVAWIAVGHLPHHAAKGTLTKAQFAALGTLVGQAYKQTDSLSLGLTGSCQTEGCLDKRRLALDKTYSRLERALAGTSYQGNCGTLRYEARIVVVNTQQLLNPMLAAVYRKQSKKANTLAGQFKSSWADFDKAVQAVHDNCAPAS